MLACANVEMIRDLAGFLALEGDWRDLSTRSSHSIFQTFEWQWRCWEQVAAPRARKLRLLVANSEGRVVLIWPLVLDGIYLKFLSSERTEYRDLLVERGPQTDTWIAEAWHALQRSARNRVLELRDIRSDGNLGPWLAEHQQRGVQAMQASLAVRLDHFETWDQYAATLPKSLVADQRRQWRRVAEWPENIRYHHVINPDEIVRTLDWCFEKKLEWLDKRALGTTEFGSQEYRSFIISVALDAHERGHLWVGRIGSESRTLSAGYGFVFNRSFILYSFTYDPAYKSLSPARLLQEMMICHCLEQRIEVFDFMGGDDAYKRIWAQEGAALLDYVQPVSVAARLLEAWHTAAISPHRYYRALCNRIRYAAGGAFPSP